MKSLVCLLSLVLLPVFSPFDAPNASAAPRREYIVISGGVALRSWENLRIPPLRHDRWWGNFIRPARVRIEKLRKMHGPSAQITWLVYRRAYARRASEEGRPLLDFIRSVRDKYNVRLVWYETGQDVIDYINRGMNRNRVKIANFDYYGHSNRHCFLFDYSSDILGASKCFLHEIQLKGLRRGSFARGAHVQSWGCHTGESMSKSWKKATGVKMWGAIGKTDYSSGTVPFLSSPGGRWVR